MNMAVQPASPCDIFRWPDGTTCYRCEWARGDYQWMGDDYEVIPQGSPAYAAANGESPCGQTCADGPAEMRTATAQHAPGGVLKGRPRPGTGGRIWRVGGSLQCSGPAPRCSLSGLCCENWRACHEQGCREQT